MKECPTCGRFYSDQGRFCPTDGAKLNESVQTTADLDEEKQRRKIPRPPEPLRMRLTIVDRDDEGHRSRLIPGLVSDVSQQGMLIETGTVETGQLNIIKDHTIAFKNKLEAEVDLPKGRIKLKGFAAWYRPAADGLNWVVGVYIKDMTAADRLLYEEYLRDLSSLASAPAKSSV